MGVGPELEPVPEIWTYIRQEELYVEKRTQGRVPTLDPDARTPAARGVGGSSQAFGQANRPGAGPADSAAGGRFLGPVASYRSRCGRPGSAKPVAAGPAFQRAAPLMCRRQYRCEMEERVLARG